VTYTVKEIFLTLQGEGGQAGKAAVFCRFAGCNLWTGREQDRHKAVCTFCDTDFVGTDGEGGGKFATPDCWPTRSRPPGPAVRTIAWWSAPAASRCCSWIRAAIEALHARGFMIAVESNGTVEAPAGIDWVCISPKADAPVVQTKGQELKLVYPQDKALPERFENLDFERFYLQPMDGPDRDRNTQLAVAYCLSHPQWRLSVQTHKYLGLP
jgi:7-carboxy-7-deazaguanine synthase